MANVIKISDSKELVPTRLYPHAKFPFDNFNVVQSAIYKVYEEDANLVAASQTSSGKAQPLDAPVLTPKGFVRMGDVKVGDYVIGSCGGSIPVTGVFPQGIKEVFRVHFSDGASADCCKDHLWAVRTRNQKHNKKGWKIKSLAEISNDLKLADGQHKWFIPLINPSEEQINSEIDSNLPLHPYALGVLLGDGGVKNDSFISSGGQYILDKIMSFLPEDCEIKYKGKYDYRISGGMHERGATPQSMRTNFVKWKLVELGLWGLGSCEKFIPEIYKNSGASSRLAILRGLMDTDGTAGGLHKAAEYTSCSYQLASDVRDLIRSLGSSCELRRGRSFYYSKERKRLYRKDRHRLTVNIGSINPFYLPRKADIQGVNLERGRNRSIIRVEQINAQECQCISVDSKDNLYVTKDYVLTHNTVICEMMLAHEVRDRGGKGMYISPLKALAQEKIDDWTDPSHHFHDLNLSICTGDYQVTESRKKELQNANLILMTSEMLSARTRNINSEKNNWIKEVGTICVDESHLITVPGRGDHLEVALMKLTEINPNLRVVFLSATLPNVDEVCGWLSKLNNKSTYLIESQYRPCPLNKQYEKYEKQGRDYGATEAAKIDAAERIVDRFPDDKFLMFVHSKDTGEIAKRRFREKGIVCEFYNADLDKEKRKKFAADFKKPNKDGGIRLLLATNGLAWGCFRYGSPVEMADGKFKAIEDIEVGENVISYTGEKFVSSPVLRVGDKYQDTALKIKLESKKHPFCEVSEDHPFYAASGREMPDWVEASRLRPGDFIALKQEKNFKKQLYFSTTDLMPVRGLLNIHCQANGLQKWTSSIWNGRDYLKFGEPSRKVLGKILQRFPERSELNKFYDAPIYWSRISSIEEVEGGVFRDIEVKDHHSYVGCGMVSHNCNFPARRVIITGVHSGFTLVPTYHTDQMSGRAGRPQYDPAGDVYILLPDEKREFESLKRHCETPTIIRSQLLESVGSKESKHYKVLAFHIVSEIHHKTIKTRKNFKTWFKRSLANHQANDLNSEIIENVLDLLLNCGAIKEEGEELIASPVGTIASMLYYSPFDISDFKKNFNQLFGKNSEKNDHALAMALGDIDSQRFGIVSKSQRIEMEGFAKEISNMFGHQTFLEPAIKAGFCYYTILQGKFSPILNSAIMGLKFDFDRTAQVLQMIDQMSSKWGRSGFFQGLKTRIKYGVKPHLVDLCGLPEIGAVRSQKLYDAGFRSVGDLAKDPDKTANVLRLKGEKLDVILEMSKKAYLRDLTNSS